MVRFIGWPEHCETPVAIDHYEMGVKTCETVFACPHCGKKGHRESFDGLADQVDRRLNLPMDPWLWNRIAA
jgi:hypothetical protein